MMPRWLGVLFVSSVCAFGLRFIWSGVTLGDVREFYWNLRHPTQIESLFDKDKPD